MADILTATINPIPDAGNKFLDETQEFMANEDANRYADMFDGFVKEGGLISPGPGLSHTPTALIAYPEGYYVTEPSGTITFTDEETTWVAVYKDKTTTVFTGQWERVTDTSYIIDETSAGQPSVPDGGLILMEVTTASGAVSEVRDLRVLEVLAGGTSEVLINAILRVNASAGQAIAAAARAEQAAKAAAIDSLGHLQILEIQVFS